MTNMFPQQLDNNSPLWAGLERFERDLVTKKDKNLLIIAGEYGTWTDPRPVAPIDPANPTDPSIAASSDGILKTKTSDGRPLITVPERVWKVIVVLEPGQGIADIDENTPIIAFDVPNAKPPAGTTTKFAKWYELPGSIISVKELENRLNNDVAHKKMGIRYNFFNQPEISDTLKNKLKQQLFTWPTGKEPLDAFF